MAIGGVNGFTPDDPDQQRRQVGASATSAGRARPCRVGVNGIWGGDGEFGNVVRPNFDGDENGLVNALGEVQPDGSPGFYAERRLPRGSTPAAIPPHGASRRPAASGSPIARASRCAASTWPDVDRGLGFGVSSSPIRSRGLHELHRTTGIETWGITATLDHLLTDNLMIRGEVRYDKIDKDNGEQRRVLQGQQRQRSAVAQERSDRARRRGHLQLQQVRRRVNQLFAERLDLEGARFRKGRAPSLLAQTGEARRIDPRGAVLATARRVCCTAEPPRFQRYTC